MARTEIELNKEVLDYKESIFFGLSLRQFICSGLAIAAAVIGFFLGKDSLGKELGGWLALSLAAPFAIAGFFHYNYLTLEQLLWQIIRSQLLYRGRRVYKTANSDRLSTDIYLLAVAKANRKSKSKCKISRK